MDIVIYVDIVIQIKLNEEVDKTQINRMTQELVRPPWSCEVL